MMRQLIAVASLLLFVFPAEKAFSAECGKVISLKGQLDLLRLKSAGSSIRYAIRAKQKEKLDCSDVLVTGRASRAKVRFINKAILTLGPHSRISILEYAKKNNDQSLLSLTYGRVRTFVESQVKKEEKPKFLIKTPSAVMGVRGTDFYVSYNPNRHITEQATLKGSVEVEQQGTGQKVLVEKGQQVKVENVQVARPKIVKKEKMQEVTVDENGQIQVPEQLAEEVPEQIKPLIVEPIEKKVVNNIKSTSVMVALDQEFTSKEAVEVLGQPENWVPSADEIPLDLKDIKEVF